MKNNQTKPMPLLLAEDDDDDFLLLKEAFRDCLIANEVIRVRDGEELLQYLRKKGKYADRQMNTDPSLILLDLNMPKMDGRTALHEIKTDPALKHYPVVVLTTSNTEEDVFRSYQTGVNAFMQKPGSFGCLVKALSSLGSFWFQIVELPSVKA